MSTGELVIALLVFCLVAEGLLMLCAVASVDQTLARIAALLEQDADE